MVVFVTAGVPVVPVPRHHSVVAGEAGWGGVFPEWAGLLLALPPIHCLTAAEAEELC